MKDHEILASGVGELSFSSPQSHTISFFDSVLVFTPSGDIIWRGRTVETDEELRRAVIDVRNCLLGVPPGPK
jgi:hypothetical protein